MFLAFMLSLFLDAWHLKLCLDVWQCFTNYILKSIAQVSHQELSAEKL